jgi:phosphoserine phosphatase
MPAYATVVFDCDSTLSDIEGIDVLAADHREAVARLTDAAMQGELPLEEVYGRRLALVRPNRARLEALAQEYVERLVPEAREVVAALLANGVEVRVVSGGLLPAVRAVARELGLVDEMVAAVDVRFDADGAYAGFDESSPLACSGGKRVQLERWIAEGLPRPILMVGDGITDLEARPPADFFAAYAGVVERPQVVAAADVVLRDRSLAAVLPLVLGEEPSGIVAVRPEKAGS